MAKICSLYTKVGLGYGRQIDKQKSLKPSSFFLTQKDVSTQKTRHRFLPIYLSHSN